MLAPESLAAIRLPPDAVVFCHITRVLLVIAYPSYVAAHHVAAHHVAAHHRDSS